jgi:cell division protein FtsB
MSRIRLFLTQTVLPACLLVAIGYNLLLTVNGPEGVRAETLLRAEIEQERARLDAAQQRTASLAQRADGLMLATLDEDLLEERLRARLGLADPAEYMVRMSDLDRIAAMETENDDTIRLAEFRP